MFATAISKIPSKVRQGVQEVVVNYLTLNRIPPLPGKMKDDFLRNDENKKALNLFLTNKILEAGIDLANSHLPRR